MATRPQASQRGPATPRAVATRSSQHVGRALDHLFAAMDELEVLGLDPEGELLVAIGDVVEQLDAAISGTSSAEQPPPGGDLAEVLVVVRALEVALAGGLAWMALHRPP